MLASRSLAAAYIKKKIPLADRILKSLERKGWVAVEEVSHDRDPLRAPSAKLRIALTGAEPQTKLPKAERELLAYLSLHPGSHNVGDLEALVHNASQDPERGPVVGRVTGHRPGDHGDHSLRAYRLAGLGQDAAQRVTGIGCFRQQQDISTVVRPH